MPEKYKSNLGDDFLSNAAYKGLGKQGLSLYEKYKNDPEIQALRKEAEVGIRRKQSPGYGGALKQAGKQAIEQLPSTIYGGLKIAAPGLNVLDRVPVVKNFLEDRLGVDTGGGQVGNVVKSTANYALPWEPFEQKRAGSYEKANKDLSRGVQMIVRRSPKTGQMEVFGAKGGNKIAHLSKKYAGADLLPGVYVWGQGDTLTPYKTVKETKTGGDILGHTEGLAGLAGSMGVGTAALGAASKGSKVGKAVVALGTPAATSIVQGGMAAARELPKVMRGESEPIDLAAFGMADREIRGPAASAVRVGGAVVAPLIAGKVFDEVGDVMSKRKLESVLARASDNTLSIAEREAARLEAEALLKAAKGRRTEGVAAGEYKKRFSDESLTPDERLTALRRSEEMTRGAKLSPEDEFANREAFDTMQRELIDQRRIGSDRVLAEAGGDRVPVGEMSRSAGGFVPGSEYDEKIGEEIDFLTSSLDRLRDKYKQKQAMNRAVSSTLDEVRRMETPPSIRGERALDAIGKERPLPFESRQAADYLEELGQKKAESVGMGRQARGTLDEAARAEGKLLTPEGAEVRNLLKKSGKQNLIQSSPALAPAAGSVYATEQAAEAEAEGNEEEAAKWKAIALAGAGAAGIIGFGAGRSLARGAGKAALGALEAGSKVSDVVGAKQTAWQKEFTPLALSKNIEMKRVKPQEIKPKEGNLLYRGSVNEARYSQEAQDIMGGPIETRGRVGWDETTERNREYMAKAGWSEEVASDPESAKEFARQMVDAPLKDESIAERSALATSVSNTLTKMVMEGSDDQELVDLAKKARLIDSIIASKQGVDFNHRKRLAEESDIPSVRANAMADALDRYGVKITPAKLREIGDAATKEIQGDRSAVDALMTKARNDVVPGNWERFQGLRYDSMLGGQKTLGRNLLSGVFVEAKETAKQALTSGIDTARSKITGQDKLISAPDVGSQIKAGFRAWKPGYAAGKRGETAGGIIKQSAGMFGDDARMGKISKGPESEGMIFPAQNVQTKLLKPAAKVWESGSRAVRGFMEASDRAVGAMAAARTLSSSLKTIAKNKGTQDIINNYVSKADPKAKGMSGLIRDLVPDGSKIEDKVLTDIVKKLGLDAEEAASIGAEAIQAAQFSTFREANAVSESIGKMVSTFSRYGKGVEKAKRTGAGARVKGTDAEGKAVDMVLDYKEAEAIGMVEDWIKSAPKDFQYTTTVLPFTSVVGNLVWKNVKAATSPFTAIAGGVKYYTSYRNAPEKVKAKYMKDLIDDMGEAAFSLATLTAGYGAFNYGLMTVEDATGSGKETDANKAAGKPRFRIHWPTGTSYDITYLSPLWPLLMSGAGMASSIKASENKAAQEGKALSGLDWAQASLEGGAEGLKSIADMPFLQGINAIFDPGKGSGWRDRVYTQMASIPASYIPQFVSETAKALDPADKEVGQGMDKFTRAIYNRIPILRDSVPDRLTGAGTVSTSQEGFKRKKLIRKKDGSLEIESKWNPTFAAFANYILPLAASEGYDEGTDEGNRRAQVSRAMDLRDEFLSIGIDESEANKLIPNDFNSMVKNNKLVMDGYTYTLTKEESRELAREYAFNTGMVLGAFFANDDLLKQAKSDNTGLSGEEMAKNIGKAYDDIWNQVKGIYFAYGKERVPDEQKRQVLISKRRMEAKRNGEP